MKPPVAILGVLLGLSSFLLASSQESQINNLENKKIYSGQIVFKDIEEESVEGVEAVFLLHTSAEKLWKVITDYEHFINNFENIKEVKVIEENATGATIELWVPTILKTFHYTVYRKYDEPLHKLTWNRISGDFKTNHGSWKIQAGNDEQDSIVTYRSFVEVGGFAGQAFKSLTRPESKKRISRMVVKLKSILEH